MAWRKGTNTNFFSFLWTILVESLIVRLADFVLIYIRIGINLQSTKCWQLTWASQDSGLNFENWIIEGRKLYSCMKQVWRFEGYSEKKRNVTWDVHHQATFNIDSVCSNTYVTYSMFIFTFTLPGLFSIRKNKKISGSKNDILLFFFLLPWLMVYKCLIETPC